MHWALVEIATSIAFDIVIYDAITLWTLKIKARKCNRINYSAVASPHMLLLCIVYIWVIGDAMNGHNRDGTAATNKYVHLAEWEFRLLICASYICKQEPRVHLTPEPIVACHINTNNNNNNKIDTAHATRHRLNVQLHWWVSIYSSSYRILMFCRTIRIGWFTMFSYFRNGSTRKMLHSVSRPFGECVVATSVCCRRWLLRRVTYHRTRMHFELWLVCRMCCDKNFAGMNTHQRRRRRRQFTFFYVSLFATQLKPFIYQNLLYFQTFVWQYASPPPPPSHEQTNRIQRNRTKKKQKTKWGNNFPTGKRISMKQRMYVY